MKGPFLSSSLRRTVPPFSFPPFQTWALTLWCGLFPTDHWPSHHSHCLSTSTDQSPSLHLGQAFISPSVNNIYLFLWLLPAEATSLSPLPWNCGHLRFLDAHSLGISLLPLWCMAFNMFSIVPLIITNDCRIIKLNSLFLLLILFNLSSPFLYTFLG